MTFYETFAEVCKIKGTTPAKAAEACGISRSVVSSWKHRGSVPRGKAIQKLAAYLGVSTECHMGINDDIIKSAEKAKQAAFEQFMRASEIYLTLCNEEIEPNENQLQWMIDDLNFSITNPKKNALIRYYSRLNREGRERALQYVMDLIKISEYTRK